MSDSQNEAVAREVNRLSGMSADELATEARVDFAYAEKVAIHKSAGSEIYWLARAATHAGLAAYQAVKEASETTTTSPEPAAPSDTL